MLRNYFMEFGMLKILKINFEMFHNTFIACVTSISFC